MNSLTSYSFHPTVASTHRLPPCFQIKPQNLSTSRHRYNGHNLFPFSLSIQVTKHTSLHAADSNVDAIISPPEGAIPVIELEEFIEKDWSLLDSDKSIVEEFNQNVELIISAGKIEETSRVMVSIGSEEFVGKLVDSSPCNLLLVVHDSLLSPDSNILNKPHPKHRVPEIT
ncbi:DNA-directed RNA polymerase subunit beta [Quillaja saponaria]|uniref:DNA-directed RNA polymerase subunit beta n=1 Tax=Quillaja saponaria TaxID=32244 RepID=A0AAD7L3C3_QUISA|nr:DNA-directed RNA polymerase subunit beta [Quillaja saponaria]